MNPSPTPVARPARDATRALALGELSRLLTLRHAIDEELVRSRDSKHRTALLGFRIRLSREVREWLAGLSAAEFSDMPQSFVDALERGVVNNTVMTLSDVQKFTSAVARVVMSRLPEREIDAFFGDLEKALA
jgi:hypothetical protein